MKVVLIVGICFVLLLAVVLVVGTLLPVAHQARRTPLIRKPAATVFGMITARWQSLPALNGHPMWEEKDARGRAIRYEQVSAEPPHKLVTRIADRNLPFGGTWTYELRSADTALTELTITEDGEVYNPLFRFVSRVILGHTATIDRTLKALQEDALRHSSGT